MIDFIFLMFFLTSFLIAAYFAFSVYNEYLKMKLLKKRKQKLDELVDVQKIADKLEEKMERRAEVKQRF